LAYSFPCFSWNWFLLRTDFPYLELKAELGVLLPLLQLELVPQKIDSPYLELKAELGVLLFLLQLESLELLQVLSNVLTKENSLEMNTN
jgi:hypothetical protein